MRRGKTGVTGEKPLKARERTNNKLNPHIATLLVSTWATPVGGEFSHHCTTLATQEVKDGTSCNTKALRKKDE